MTKRVKLVTKIPEPLVKLMERIAAKKKWDLDLVHEEALIFYINGELGKTLPAEAK